MEWDSKKQVTSSYPQGYRFESWNTTFGDEKRKQTLWKTYVSCKKSSIPHSFFFCMNQLLRHKGLCYLVGLRPRGRRFESKKGGLGLMKKTPSRVPLREKGSGAQIRIPSRCSRGTNTCKIIGCERRLRTFRLHRAAPATVRCETESWNRGLGLQGWTF